MVYEPPDLLALLEVAGAACADCGDRYGTPPDSNVAWRIGTCHICGIRGTVADASFFGWFQTTRSRLSRAAGET